MRILGKHGVAPPHVPLGNTPAIVVERLGFMNESGPPGAIGLHRHAIAAPCGEIAKLERGERVPGRSVDRMEVVEHIDEDPARALSIEYLDECVAVTAEAVERKCPLTDEDPRRVCEANIGSYEIGTITVALLDSTVRGDKVRANRTLVGGIRHEVRGQGLRHRPIVLPLAYAERLHDRQI